MFSVGSKTLKISYCYHLKWWICCFFFLIFYSYAHIANIHVQVQIGENGFSIEISLPWVPEKTVLIKMYSLKNEAEGTMIILFLLISFDVYTKVSMITITFNITDYRKSVFFSTILKFLLYPTHFYEAVSVLKVVKPDCFL